MPATTHAALRTLPEHRDEYHETKNRLRFVMSADLREEMEDTLRDLERTPVCGNGRRAKDPVSTAKPFEVTCSECRARLGLEDAEAS